MTARTSLMFEAINSRDYRLMRRVNRWHAPRWIRMWAISATRGGDGWLWYAISGALLLFGGTQRFEAVGAAAVAATLGAAIFAWLKNATQRTRPWHVEPHAWAKLLPPDQFSFPSGHTITAFAFAIPFSMFYPTLAPALFFCAVSIGASRILLGMHFLSDVLVGTLIGSALGYGAYQLFV